MARYKDKKTGKRVSESTWKRSKAHGGTRYVRELSQAQRRVQEARGALKEAQASLKSTHQRLRAIEREIAKAERLAKKQGAGNRKQIAKIAKAFKKAIAPSKKIKKLPAPPKRKPITKKEKLIKATKEKLPRSEYFIKAPTGKRSGPHGDSRIMFEIKLIGPRGASDAEARHAALQYVQYNQAPQDWKGEEISWTKPNRPGRKHFDIQGLETALQGSLFN